MPPIKLFLLTGFLGAGKTTLIKNLLDQFCEYRCGVLENDFGEVNIDSIVISQRKSNQPFELMEITNGSIFCSCRHDLFIEALFQLAQKPIDILFIESSGLGDPTPILQDLIIVDHKIGPRFQLERIICVIDALNFEDLVEVTPIIERQIKQAHVILLNKIDMQSLEKVNVIEKRIKEINSLCQIFKVTYSKITKTMILESENMFSNLNGSDGLNKPENRPVNMTLNSDAIFSKKEISEFLTQISPFLFRIKGFVQFRNEWIYLDGVNGNWNMNVLSGKEVHPDLSQIVCIFKPQIDGTLLERIPQVWNKMGEKYSQK